MSTVDFLIAGQGLAGTFLAHYLLEKGCKIKVINQFQNHSASLVSSGIYNPITGRKLVKVWLADELEAFLPTAYQSVERSLEKLYYQKIPVIKLFSSEESNAFLQKNISKDTQKHIRFLSSLELQQIKELKPAIAGIEIYNTAMVDISLLLRDFEQKLLKNKLLLQEKLDYNKIKICKEHIQYKEIKTHKIIFCEGAEVRHNPWFNHLPIIPNKGDFLRVKIKNFPVNKIIHFGIFIVPLYKDVFWCGSNYQYSFKHYQPCLVDQLDLIGRLKKVVLQPFEVLEHQFGIRPTTIDRRPIIGAHPIHQNLMIFNGLGTKGISLAPYFARQLSEHLMMQSPLLSEVLLSRFQN